MEIKRDRYLNQLVSKMWNGHVKVITGIRRCGKSYLLKTIFKRHLLQNGVSEADILVIELDDIKAGVWKLASMRLCSNTLTQLCIPAALADNDSTKAMIVPGGRLYEQRRATIDGLTGIDGLSFVPNDA